MKQHHHCGRIYSHLQGSASSQQIDVWIDDIEHGLFHGLCTGMASGFVLQDEFPQMVELIGKAGEFLYIKEKNLQNRQQALDISKMIDVRTYSDYESKHAYEPISFERLAASCLLHDFVKCNRVNDLGHDADLERIFPDLLPATYTHAWPPNAHHPLIIADVLELRRFPDWRDWYRPGEIEPFLSEAQLEMAVCFYDCIRPALEQIFKYRDEPWISHGPEVPQTLPGNYPQHPVEWIAVEIDRAPFENCLVHDNAMASAPWSCLKGVMNFSKFKSLNGLAKPHQECYRDHLYAKVKAQFTDWVFLTDSEVTPHADWVKPMIESLVTQKVPIVSRKLVNKLIRLSTLIEDRMKIMNHCINTAG